MKQKHRQENAETEYAASKNVRDHMIPDGRLFWISKYNINISEERGTTLCEVLWVILKETKNLIELWHVST